MKNNMRTKICTALLGLLIFPVVSCKKLLDEKSFSKQDLNEFYQNNDQANLALNGVYATLWDYIYKDGYYIMLGDVPGETVQANMNKDEFDLYNWTASTSRFDNYWIACYTGINRANTLIDKIQPANIQENVKNNITAQAKFLRALFYFNLVKAFGGVPLHVNASLDLSSVAMPRSSESEVYAQIIKDLTEAESTIGAYSPADHSTGKVTLGAVKSLLSKVYLQNKQWELAAKKAKEVIDMNVYDLLADYSQLWNPAFKNGKEHIFSVQNGGASNLPTSSDKVYDFFTIPRVFHNGKQVEFSIDGGGTRVEITPDFYNTDPATYRRYHSYRNTMPYYFEVGSNVRIDQTVTLDRIYVVKYFHPDLATKQLRSSVNSTVLRYSDILLTYVEAVNEYSAVTPDVLEYLNKVRRRARAVGTSAEQDASIYPDIQPGLSQQEMRNVLLQERAREFLGEGERRNDLNRHDLLIATAQKEMNKTIKPGYKLYPIPSTQLSLNDLLVQNPDY